MKKFIVILAGGEGKRLQAKTGEDCPKQFYRASLGAKIC
jgi:mannose-1-phosphate guanylyltransferase